VDVLLVPVGGKYTLGSAKAAEVVGLLEPKIVVPMHYKVPGLNLQIDGVNRFLKELALEPPGKLEALTITKSQLPEETRVVLLEPKQ
jgi:L-ascorbate metabolism protein UlaG (beta-lactamase superfamily)